MAIGESLEMGKRLCCSLMEKELHISRKVVQELLEIPKSLMERLTKWIDLNCFLNSEFNCFLSHDHYNHHNHHNHIHGNYHQHNHHNSHNHVLFLFVISQ